MIAGTLELQILADLARLQADMNSAKGIVSGATKAMEEAFKSVKEAVVDMAGALSAAGFAEAIKSAIEYGDQLDKLSQRTGITTEALSQLAYAAQQGGVSGDAMTLAIKKLNVSINDALAGNTKYTQAFANLGVQLKDATGKTITADQALLQIASRFSTANDGATKTAYAVALMGKSGDELIPVLNKGSDGIKNLMEQADQLGATVGDDFAKKADQFNSSLGALKAQTDAWWRQLAGQLLPTMQAIVTELIEIKKASSDAGSGHSLLGDTLVTVFQTIAVLGANVVYVLKQTGVELGGIAAQAAAIARLDFTGAAQIHQMMVQDAEKARQSVDATSTRILSSSGTPDASEAGFGILNAAVMSGGAKTQLPPVDNTGSAKAATDAYNSLIETIKKKIAADNEELAAGRALTDTEKYAIEIRTQETKLLEKYPGLNKAVIDSFIATALARDKDVAAMKAQQQNNANYAKDWEKEQADMAAFEKARADERDRLLASYRQENDSLTDANQLLQAEGQMLGSTDRDRQTYLANLQIELNLKRQLQKIDEDRMLSPEARDLAKAAAEADADLQHQQVELKAQLDLWHSIDDAARQAFDNIGQKGENVFKALGDALKKYLLDQLYQMTVRPWIIQIAGSLGLPGLGGVGQSGGVAPNPYASGGSLSNLFSSGSNSFSSMFTSGSIGNFLGASAAGVPANPYLGSTAALGAVGNAVPYLGALYSASQGKYGAAAGQAIGTAILPGVGTVIGGIIGSLFDGKGGGPKQDGVYGTIASGIGQGQRSAASDSAAKQSALSIQSTYDSIVNAYGGNDTLKYGLGFSMDPKGTSPSFVDITATNNGSVAYTDLNRNAGRSQDELTAAIGDMTTRAVLAGLQQSNLQGMIGQYLKSLGDVSKLSLDDATAALNRVQKAMTEKQQLEDQIYQMTASAEDQLAKQRQDELAALDESNRALEQRVFALQDEQKASATLAQALSDAKNSAAAWATFIAGINQNLRGYIDKLNATSAGGLSPEQQLANAKLQFDQQSQLAAAGDQNALQNITSYADQLIQAQQAYGGSGTDTANVIAGVKSKLAGLPQMQSTEDYLAQVINNASAQQVQATKDAGDKIWDGLWGSAGLLAQNFTTLDTNVDGLLSADELKAALGPLASDATIHSLIARVDTNGDGQISKLEAINAAVAESAAVQAQATQTAATTISSNVSNAVTISTGVFAKDVQNAITLAFTGNGHDYTSTGSGLGGSINGAFAMGGVMTPGGPLPLHRYASGGVATSPQIAIFGEGRMPEAYVPLPDGRSIPVNMGNGMQSLIREVQALRAEVQQLRGVAQKGNEIVAAGARGTFDRLDRVGDNTEAAARKARLDARRVPA